MLNNEVQIHLPFQACRYLLICIQPIACQLYTQTMIHGHTLNLEYLYRIHCTEESQKYGGRSNKCHKCMHSYVKLNSEEPLSERRIGGRGTPRYLPCSIDSCTVWWWWTTNKLGTEIAPFAILMSYCPMVTFICWPNDKRRGRNCTNFCHYFYLKGQE